MSKTTRSFLAVGALVLLVIAAAALNLLLNSNARRARHPGVVAELPTTGPATAAAGEEEVPATTTAATPPAAPANEDGIALLPPSASPPPAAAAVPGDVASFVGFAPGGRLLVARSGGAVEFVHLTSGQRQPVELRLPSPRAVALSPDGDRIAVANAQATEIWHVASASRTRLAAGGDVTFLSFTRGGGLLTGHASGEVKTWDAPSWTNVATLRPNVGAVARVVASPATAHVAVIGASGGVAVCDSSDGQVKQRLGGDKAWSSVDFSPDGRTLAAAGPAGIFMWDTMLWQPRAAPSTPADQPPTHVAFWRGGTVIVTAGADGAIRIYDVATRQLLTTLAGGGPIVSFALADDARSIATSSGARVTIWDASTRTVARVFNP